MKNSYLFKQPNSLTPRTAIGREQKQFIKIAFAVHLSAVIPAERYRSDSGALKSAVLNFVFFVMLKNKIEQSAKRNSLLKNPTDRAFENRHDGCKEREKINRRRIFDTLRINFFEATPQTACIFSKEYYRYDANGYITAEKDGKFSDKEEITFTYSYFAEHDVYGVDYGFDLEPPEEDPANLEGGISTGSGIQGGYRRDYTWNERNLLIKSDDKLNTVIYRYGDDGQRALKFTQQSNSETLYFNNFYSVHQVAHEPNHEHGLRVSKHIFVGNSRLVTAMTHADNNGDTTEQTEKRYYYHADHLQSAQFITNAKGEQYEHIEYTPYGELWIEETAPGIDKLPFRFTGKELDEETGLYYYGARYLDPKYSRWLSGDPALNDYIPKAPIDDEAKKHNENLPGMGGVFNTVNLHVYHYAGNNPIKYVDPDGRININPYHIKDISLYPINTRMEIIPLGGGYTETQSDLYKITDMIQALIGTTGLGDYQTIVTIPYGDLSSIVLETVRGVAGAISKKVSYANSITDLAVALFSTPRGESSVYTKNEKEFLVMVGVEQHFISELADNLQEYGCIVKINKDGNSDFIKNITVISDNYIQTKDGIKPSKDAILFITNELKNSRAIYNDIKINY